MSEILLPVSGARWFRLVGPFPMTEEEWSRLQALLTAMKPGLVQHADPPPKESSR